MSKFEINKNVVKLSNKNFKFTHCQLHKIHFDKLADSAKWFRQEVLMRLAYPGTSKRYHAKKLSKQEGHQISEVKLYRMMDRFTDSRIKQVQGVITSEVLALLGGTIDILFFDATTFSFSTREDDKDSVMKEIEEGGKAQEKQVDK